MFVACVNRIFNSGQSLSNTGLLVVLNVTHSEKQPSWEVGGDISYFWLFFPPLRGTKKKISMLTS